MADNQTTVRFTGALELELQRFNLTPSPTPVTTEDTSNPSVFPPSRFEIGGAATLEQLVTDLLGQTNFNIGGLLNGSNDVTGLPEYLTNGERTAPNGFSDSSQPDILTNPFSDINLPSLSDIENFLGLQSGSLKYDSLSVGLSFGTNFGLSDLNTLSGLSRGGNNSSEIVNSLGNLFTIGNAFPGVAAADNFLERVLNLGSAEFSLPAFFSDLGFSNAVSFIKIGFNLNLSNSDALNRVNNGVSNGSFGDNPINNIQYNPM